MNINILNKGMEITVIAFGGRRLRRRVWEDLEDSVLVCTEEEYRRALHYNEEAICSGVPKNDVVEVHSTSLTKDDTSLAKGA